GPHAARGDRGAGRRAGRHAAHRRAHRPVRRHPRGDEGDLRLRPAAGGGAARPVLPRRHLRGGRPPPAGAGVAVDPQPGVVLPLHAQRQLPRLPHRRVPRAQGAARRPVQRRPAACPAGDGRPPERRLHAPQPAGPAAPHLTPRSPAPGARSPPAPPPPHPPRRGTTHDHTWGGRGRARRRSYTDGGREPLDDRRGGDVADTDTLLPEEQHTWSTITGLLTTLPAVLDAALGRAANLTYFEYTALAALAAAEGRTLSMSTLAHRTHGSLSRVSHVIR